MITYKQLEKEFNDKVKEMQKECPHKHISEWCDQHWAIGHPTGFQVKVCDDCRKEIAKRTICMKCKKLTEDYINGDGKRRPYGEYLCKECDKR